MADPIGAPVTHCGECRQLFEVHGEVEEYDHPLVGERLRAMTRLCPRCRNGAYERGIIDLPAAPPPLAEQPDSAGAAGGAPAARQPDSAVGASDGTPPQTADAPAS